MINPIMLIKYHKYYGNTSCRASVHDYASGRGSLGVSPKQKINPHSLVLIRLSLLSPHPTPCAYPSGLKAAWLLIRLPPSPTAHSSGCRAVPFPPIADRARLS